MTLAHLTKSLETPDLKAAASLNSLQGLFNLNNPCRLLRLNLVCVTWPEKNVPAFKIDIFTFKSEWEDETRGLPPNSLASPQTYR